VKGVRTDVLVVDAGRLRYGWYEAHLRRLDGRLKPGSDPTSFATANVARGRPVYFEAAPSDLPGLTPAGPLVRLGGAGEPRGWEVPVTPDEARARRRRERGIRLLANMDVEPEAYEDRWVAAAARAQAGLGRFRFLQKEYRGASEALEAARAADPARPDPEVIHLSGVCFYLLNEYDRAEPLLKLSLRLRATPRQTVRALTYLSTICQKQGRKQEALRYQEQAMTVVGADPELRREFEQRR
jgi:tetratricopeptide (TPR) repeat protein